MKVYTLTLTCSSSFKKARPSFTSTEDQTTTRFRVFQRLKTETHPKLAQGCVRATNRQLSED